MYAVVKTGGKQYRVSKDDKIMVEAIKADAGSIIYLDNVLLLDNDGNITVGTPTIQGAIVSAEVIKKARGPKLIIFRRKRRKNHRRIRGHRQDLTLLKILDISPEGKPKSLASKKTKVDDEGKDKPQKIVDKKPVAKKTVSKKTTAKKTATKKTAAKKTATKKTATKKTAAKK